MVSPAQSSPSHPPAEEESWLIVRILFALWGLAGSDEKGGRAYAGDLLELCPQERLLLAEIGSGHAPPQMSGQGGLLEHNLQKTVFGPHRPGPGTQDTWSFLHKPEALCPSTEARSPGRAMLTV